MEIELSRVNIDNTCFVCTTPFKKYKDKSNKTQSLHLFTHLNPLEMAKHNLRELNAINKTAF